MKAPLFVSSAQKELQAERRAIKEYVQEDPVLRRFFDVFLFEDLPASGRRADHVYLREVDRCGVYVGLIGNEYSSPTEREFDRATSKGKERLIFVKGTDDKARDPKMQALMKKAAAQVVRRRFKTTEQLLQRLHESLADHLTDHGIIDDRPYEERLPPEATVADVDPERVRAFVRRARAERRLRLPEETPAPDVLTHLGVLRDGRPTMAAVLLFGRDPYKLHPASQVGCMHFHGTTVQRPAPSHQVFKGTLFEQADRAVDFVLSVLNRRVGTREHGPQAPVTYDVPADAVHEAIVNAVVHRDYASRGFVQVSVFADRVEVSNPGGLPPELTPEKLREPHRSIPRNGRICDAFFATRYIEKQGTGTLMMIEQCRKAGLPEPEFTPEPGGFVLTVWRDWLTDEVLAGANLSERQVMAIRRIKITGRITSGEYQELVGAPPRTATRDLDELVKKKLLRKVGKAGRGVHYVIPGQSAKNRPNRPSLEAGKQASNRPNRPSAPAFREGATKGSTRAGGVKGDKKGTKGTSRRGSP